MFPAVWGPMLCLRCIWQASQDLATLCLTLAKLSHVQLPARAKLGLP